MTVKRVFSSYSRAVRYAWKVGAYVVQTARAEWSVTRQVPLCGVRPHV